MQNFGGQIRCIMGDVQVANPAILTEQAWSIKYLFYCQIIVVLIHYGLSCYYLVFYDEQATKTLIYLIFSLTLPSVLSSMLNVPMVFLFFARNPTSN